MTDPTPEEAARAAMADQHIAMIAALPINISNRQRGEIAQALADSYLAVRAAATEEAQERIEALEAALRRIVKLREDDQAFRYQNDTPEMGRRVGWEDAALIARAALGVTATGPRE